MKVSKDWLKELVDLKVSTEELIHLLPLRTIAVKEDAPDYFELDMKGYNRADLLSLRGVAYEVAAITDSKINFTEPSDNEYIWVGQNLPNAEISGSISSKAFMYCIAKIESLEVKSPPPKWVSKLQASGMRSVNDVTDITNLAMLEYGQPMHAFDASKSEGIHVEECPFDGWKFITLDGKERTLKEGDILIRNRTDIIGLGGIMGGKNSEVTEKTTSIYLEAAIFDPIQIRKTATRLRLQSEASKRFYHGLTKKRLFQALNAAIKMYQDLGGTLTALTIVDNSSKTPPLTLSLTQNKINSLIGINISPQDIENYLNKLHFTLASHMESGNVNWEVTPPYFRLDIGIEEDLIEEVARMYGYEKIPAKPLNNNIPQMQGNPIFGLMQRLKGALLNLGLTEVQTYSYFSTEVIENLEFRIQNLIKIANPISKETEYMRNDIWPNLVEVVARNVKRGFKEVVIFEIGKIYFRNEKEESNEKYVLSMALMDGSDNPLSELYNLFSKLNKELGLRIEQTEEGATELFHPNRFIKLIRNREIVGKAGEVHKRITDKLGISQRTAVLEIDLDKLV